MLDLRHMNLSETERIILKTLAHFDVLDYPLTLLEIRRYAGAPIAFNEIMATLKNENLAGLVSQSQGLYFLSGRESLIANRLKRYHLALLKLKKAKFYGRIFSLFPWVRAVAVYSSLALKNSRVDSDIDLFFIAAKGRVWSARLFINAFLKIFHLRPTPKDSRDRLCASYLVDENHLDLSAVNLQDDYFYTYGCAAFYFVYADTKTENEFWRANDWIKKILPAWQPAHSQKTIQPSAFNRHWQKLLELILNPVSENAGREWQLKIMPPKYALNQDGKKVVLAAGLIKLHDNDKRTEYNRLFENNFRQIVSYEKRI